MGKSNYITYIGAAGIAVVVILTLYLNSRRRMKYGEILPASKMKAKYGLTAERYKPPRLDPEQVPEHLRDLIPLAEKWGIGDDIIRDDFESKAGESEKDEFRAKLRGRTKQVNDWLDSFEAGKPMPEAAAHFMYMLEALDEMGLGPD